MPQSVAFAYFSVHCEKQSVSKVGLIPYVRGRRVALRPLEKAGAHILREFLGPRKYTLSTVSTVSQ